MLTLHQPPRAWGMPNMSPFCLKLETYLRMTAVPYRTARPSLRGGPKGKVPYITDGDLVLGDSSFIVDHLKNTRGDPLDGALDAESRARGHVVRRFLEEHLYFALAYLRWTAPEAFPHLVDGLAPMLPAPLRTLVPKVIRGRIVKKAYAQGIGRHTREEIFGLVAADLAALSSFVGDRPFVLGDAATSYDATAYGLLAQIHGAPWPSTEKDLLLRHDNLVAFIVRMRERFWAGWSVDADPASA